MLVLKNHMTNHTRVMRQYSGQELYQRNFLPISFGYLSYAETNFLKQLIATESVCC